MKCNVCDGTGTAVLQTADGEKEPEQCLCVLEEDYFSFLKRHGIPEAEREIEMKGYVRFQNGIVSICGRGRITQKMFTVWLSS